MKSNFKRLGGPCLALLFLATSFVVGPALAETITITLDDVTVSACEEIWHEAGLPLWFTETTADDYTPGFCLFVADANNFGLEGIYLWPGRLALDLSGLQGLESVEVDIYETHFAGSTRARLYHDGSPHRFTFEFEFTDRCISVPHISE